jgi:hypothetical protein
MKLNFGDPLAYIGDPFGYTGVPFECISITKQNHYCMMKRSQTESLLHDVISQAESLLHDEKILNRIIIT